MFHEFSSILREFFRQSAGSLYHIVIVAMSAGVALLLPIGAARFLSFWSHVEQDKVSLIAVEMTAAVLLMAGINFVHRSLRDRALADAARGAGLVSFFPRPAPEAQRRIMHVKEEQGAGRTVMVIGSSGSGSLMDQVGDLSSVLDRCLEAKIFLVNPFAQGTQARMEAFGRPAGALPAFREEVRQSITVLKQLKAMGKVVKLKLYSDPPLVKLVILGEYLWLQHGPADPAVQHMPEYVLRRSRKEQGLYTFYAQYFLQRWENADFPEYDLETDELVYRSRTGQEIRREPVEIGPASFGHEPPKHPCVDAGDPFQLLHAPGPYLPVRGYDVD